VLLDLQRRRSSRSGIGPVIGVTVATALVASLAWTGHAVGVHALHLLVDVVHLLAAALWVGMLAPLWLVVWRSTLSHAWHQLALSAADRFFWPGVIAVLALAASGAANAVWLVGSLHDLVATRYGLLVVAKVVLFAAMVLAATVNRALTRRLRVGSLDGASRAARALRASATVELLCGAMAIAVVALLGVTAPPSHQHPMHHMHGM
jgi:copper resistance protein D